MRLLLLALAVAALAGCVGRPVASCAPADPAPVPEGGVPVVLYVANRQPEPVCVDVRMQGVLQYRGELPAEEGVHAFPVEVAQTRAQRGVAVVTVAEHGGRDLREDVALEPQNHVVIWLERAGIRVENHATRPAYD